MKKIPTLFERVFEGRKIVGITPNVIPGMEWVLEGEGEATIKVDGSCCAIINGELYKRYDAKKGKKPPEGAIPCCEPDETTGHWPHWLKCSENNPGDKWFIAAFERSNKYNGLSKLEDGTYEAIGEHFQGNPYNCADRLEKHGKLKIKVDRTFEGIKQYLETHIIEGIVFWKDGEPRCKIKRSDFGFDWPVKKKE